MRPLLALIATLTIACASEGGGPVASKDESVRPTPGTGGHTHIGTSGSGGGGSTMQPGADYYSGSRLKRRYVTASDGLRALRPGRYYDSQEGVDCVEGVTAGDFASDNSLLPRCLPEAVAEGCWYADEDCTEPVYRVYDGQQPAKHVQLQRCNKPVTISSHAVLSWAPAELYRDNGSGTTVCQPYPLNHQGDGFYLLDADMTAQLVPMKGWVEQ